MANADAESGRAVDLIVLREALEASWSPATSYKGIWSEANPALGQCYPTSRVVQRFLPATEIVRGSVWTGLAYERHFWNLVHLDHQRIVIDLTWQQFPPRSVVTTYEILDRDELNDSPPTVERCRRLLKDVHDYLHARSVPPQ